MGLQKTKCVIAGRRLSGLGAPKFWTVFSLLHLVFASIGYALRFFVPAVALFELIRTFLHAPQPNMATFLGGASLVFAFFLILGFSFSLKALHELLESNPEEVDYETFIGVFGRQNFKMESSSHTARIVGEGSAALFFLIATSRFNFSYPPRNSILIASLVLFVALWIFDFFLSRTVASNFQVKKPSSSSPLANGLLEQVEPSFSPGWKAVLFWMVIICFFAVLFFFQNRT